MTGIFRDWYLVMKSTKLRVTKLFDFHMAHALDGYEGACSHIHGHTYRLAVTFIGESSDDGMVVDFKQLKEHVSCSVLDYYDHSLLLHKTRENAASCDAVSAGWDKVHLISVRPTCENILLDIVGRISENLPDGVNLFSVRLNETDTSYAEWFFEDNRSL